MRGAIFIERTCDGLFSGHAEDLALPLRKDLTWFFKLLTAAEARGYDAMVQGKTSGISKRQIFVGKLFCELCIILSGQPAECCVYPESAWAFGGLLHGWR
jgi:hypothetical protein